MTNDIEFDTQVAYEMERDIGLRIKALHDIRENHLNEIRELRSELALAVAHDRQEYPTAAAYETVCAVLNRTKSQRDELLKLLKRYFGETPLGNQPHMIYGMANVLIRECEAAP